MRPCCGFLSIRHLLVRLITNKEWLSLFILIVLLIVVETYAVVCAELLHRFFTTILQHVLDLTLDLIELVSHRLALPLLV